MGTKTSGKRDNQKESDFWEAVNPYLEQDGVITIENLQIALGQPKEKAEEIAAHFCEVHKLFRVVTRHSWGYIRIDQEEVVENRPMRCGYWRTRQRNV